MHFFRRWQHCKRRSTFHLQSGTNTWSLQSTPVRFSGYFTEVKNAEWPASRLSLSHFLSLSLLPGRRQPIANCYLALTRWRIRRAIPTDLHLHPRWRRQEQKLRRVVYRLIEFITQKNSCSVHTNNQSTTCGCVNRHVDLVSIAAILSPNQKYIKDL